MNVVLDTNIVVSGIYFKGAPYYILKAWLEGAFKVYATPAILAEYFEVIDDLAHHKKPSFGHDWKMVLPEICHLVPDEKHKQPISRDASDDKFIYCAQNAKAQYLVSGDDD